ncbi:MAG: hypothetical protein U0136_02655 [Bdellovibrionota bacterium]
MFQGNFKLLTAGVLTGLISFTPVARAQDATVTEPGFISGTMNIDFQTRKSTDTTGKLAEGSPAEGAQDVYSLNLNVAKTTEYAGKIERKPRLVSKLLGREVQAAELVYDIGLSVRNPQNLEQKKAVGKWVGHVGINEHGVYDFGSETANASQLRMAIDAVGKAQAFVGGFSGKIYGKDQEKKGELEQKISEYTRLVKGKTVKVTAKRVDPLRFSGLVLGEGPAQIYPRTLVDGNLDYDYDTGNWYTNGIRFKYTANGKEVEDVVTGSIKWVEDPSRASNGKGQYEFNLRFNEAKNQPATDESAAFGDQQGEDAFFAVDNSIPAMTGNVSYEDTLVSGGEDEPTVTASKVTYNLNANKLTKIQAVNFFKLWMVIVGPTNDE